MKRKTIKQILKRYVAVCLIVVMYLTGFTEITQTSNARPIIYLCGLKGTETSNFDDTTYFSNVEQSYLYGNSKAIVYKRYYLRNLYDLEVMLSGGNYIWVSTHGNDGKIATYDTDGNLNGSISVNDFLKYDSDEFSNVKLCVLLSCKSASTNLNVCNAIQQRGAKCVIGFKKSIEGTSAVKWQKYFADAQSIGWTVSAAVRYADKMVYSEENEEIGESWAYGGLDSHVIYGDADLVYTED